VEIFSFIQNQLSKNRQKNTGFKLISSQGLLEKTKQSEQGTETDQIEYQLQKMINLHKQLGIIEKELYTQYLAVSFCSCPKARENKIKDF
jgi:hypothetical protein